MRQAFSAFFLFLLAAAIVALGIFLGSCSFERLQQMRELERVPHTDIVAVLPGEVNLEGEIELGNELGLGRGLTSPDTNTRCVYYRYHVEERYTDSDGNTRWRTITDRTNYEPFVLTDETGSLVVHPSSRVNFTVNRSFYQRRGDRRYSEYRLDPGDRIFCFGYAQREGEPLPFAVSFTTKGSYTPILSEEGELGERVSMASESLFAVWGSVSLLSLAVLLVCLVFKVHRTIVYLGFVALALASGLSIWGVQMIEDDLSKAHERLEQHADQAEREWNTSLTEQRIDWDGEWASLGTLEQARYAALSERQRERLSRIRMNLWRATERTNEILSRFPERLLAPQFGIEPFPELPLPEEELALASELDEVHEPAKISSMLALGVGLGALLVGVILTRFGLRRIKHKRYTENIPTSPTNGAAWGPTELVGKVVCVEAQEPLKGPLSNRDCVQYHYEVKERRSSGKNSKWVTIEERERRQNFYCVDAHGRIRIEPEGAEVMTRHTTSRRRGRRHYSETRLEVNDRLYALGYVKAPPPDYDELKMLKTEDAVLSDFPYLLANLTEAQVRFRLARRGFFMLNIALSAVVLVALLLFGATGSFAATDYLLAAMIAPFYLLVLLGILMYNDLAFLSNRVGSTRGNIEVALKKRHDLIPQLEETVKQYMAHEEGLIERITQLRTQGRTASIDEPSLGGLAAVVEDYPELKAHENMSHLMQTLVQVENEIAMMRHGYNQAVERYNSRIEHIPETYIAKLVGYEPAELFRAEYSVRTVPKVALPASESATPDAAHTDGKPLSESAQQSGEATRSDTTGPFDWPGSSGGAPPTGPTAAG